jgi:hypothetical protein
MTADQAVIDQTTYSMQKSGFIRLIFIVAATVLFYSHHVEIHIFPNKRFFRL